MRILFIGDIVGRPGLQIVYRTVRGLRIRESLDVVIANAENAEDGSGITRTIFNRLLQNGIDGITLGDHIYRKREIIPVLETDDRVVRPANFPPEAPGKQWMAIPTPGGKPLIVISLMGRVFMRPVDCPFHAAERVLAEIPESRCGVLVDFHAEATSDKQLMGRFLDGRVSAVLGTHTHVTTADEQIFPGGTAFQCDVGMTGPHDGIIGRQYERVMETTFSCRPTSFNVAKKDPRLCGTIVDVDPETGKATGIRRLVVDAKQVSRLESLADTHAAQAGSQPAGEEQAGVESNGGASSGEDKTG